MNGYCEASTEGGDVEVFNHPVDFFEAEAIASAGAYVEYWDFSLVGEIFLPYGENISPKCGIDFFKIFRFEVFACHAIAQCLAAYTKFRG